MKIKIGEIRYQDILNIVIEYFQRILHPKTSCNYYKYDSSTQSYICLYSEEKGVIAIKWIAYFVLTT